MIARARVVAVGERLVLAVDAVASYAVGDEIVVTLPDPPSTDRPSEDDVPTTPDLARSIAG